MDLLQVIGLLSPVFLSLIVQGLKKIFAVNGIIALAMVFVIGGLAAVVGVGPKPDAGWIDTVVNSGWIIGVATFIYGLFKTQK